METPTRQTLPGQPALLRRLNLAAVLNVIRANGPLASAEIAARTGLSKPTVNEAVAILAELDYIAQSVETTAARPTRPGRRPRIFSFRADVGHVLGLDIGAKKVLAMVADLDGAVRASERHATTDLDRKNPEGLIDSAIAVAKKALFGAGISANRLSSVVVGTPGVVDPGTGTVALAPQLDGWEHIRLSSELERRLGVPAHVENEVHLSMLAERWRGAAQSSDNVLYVQIGVGIGAGIMISGEIYRGADGAAGEIGYLPICDRPPGAEGVGPFEYAAGGAAFARLGREAASTPEGSAILELSGGDPSAIDAEIVIAAAAHGDPCALGILTELTDRLARGIAAAAIVLNPSTVIIGGGVSRAGSILLDRLERRITALTPVPPQVVLSTLGDESVALGAIRMAGRAAAESLFDTLIIEAG